VACDDDTVPDDSALARWHRYFVDASEKLGASTNSAARYKQQLIDAGFEDVVQVGYKWPINDWPKDPKHKEIGESARVEYMSHSLTARRPGIWSHVNSESGLQGLSLMLFTKVLGWSATEVETFLVSVRRDLRNRNMHAYWPV
jgi:hypothetical protein